MQKRLALLVAAFVLVGCKSGSAPEKAAEAKTAFDPCENLRRVNPHCGWKPHWDDSGISTNAIDGIKTEHLSLESSDADGLSAGALTFAELRVCFENGKLCGHDIVGVGVTVNGMVAPLDYEHEHESSVRVKFDEEKPTRQTWGISDNHESLFPRRREKPFLAELLKHNKLILEFSYYEKVPETVTFELAGLGEKMKSIGIAPQTVLREQAAADRAKVAANRAEVEAERAKRAKVEGQIHPCQRSHAPIPLEASKKMFCWDPHDEIGERGPFATREEAIEVALHGFY
jgi:hypothetical protein